MMKFDIKKYFTPKIIRSIFMLFLIIILSACDKPEDGMGKGSQENYNKQSDCWQTYIINAVTKIIDTLFGKGSDIITGNQGSAVIMVGFAIWMGFKFLKILPSFKAQNLGEILTEIGQKLFLCAFCAWAASSKAEMIWLIDTFILPIYNTILSLASSVIDVNPSIQLDLGDIGTETFTNNYTECQAPEVSLGQSIKGAISPMMNCVVCSISSRLNAGVKIGIELICSLKFSAIILGILLIVFFTCAKFGFILFVVDSLFRLNFNIFLFTLSIIDLHANGLLIAF